jgi:AraC family transcriptional regulator
MIIYFKNMVCMRCKMAVQTVLEGLQIDYIRVELDKVKLTTALEPDKQKKLAEGLQHYQLELIDNKKRS